MTTPCSATLATLYLNLVEIVYFPFFLIKSNNNFSDRYSETLVKYTITTFVVYSVVGNIFAILNGITGGCQLSVPSEAQEVDQNVYVLHFCLW